MIRVVGSVCFLIVFVSGIIQHNHIQQYFLRKYYYYSDFKGLHHFLSIQPNWPKIERHRSLYHNIDLVKRLSYQNPLTEIIIGAYSSKQREDPDFPREYALFLNGDFQFNTDIEEIYHEYFAHIPIILNGRVPRNVLVLGAGDGLLIRELLKYKKIKSIKHVEIDPLIVELAVKHPVLTYANKKSLTDPRVETIFADAYHFLRTSQQSFDAIYMDFPDPSEYNLSKLYSREFYHFVRNHLTAKGYAVFDATGIGSFYIKEQDDYWIMEDTNPWDIYAHTVKAAGFRTIKPFAINLELDNPKIIRTIDRGIEDLLKERKNLPFIQTYQKMVQIKGKDYMIRKFMEGHMSALRQGFIMMTDVQIQDSAKFDNFGLKHYVLNEQRFYLSLSYPFDIPRTVDFKLVNSIMRTTLPNANFLYKMKLPY